MPFVSDAWYMAGWSSEIGRTPLARTILGRPMVFYRTEAGGAVALGDICPHRFAPLSKGSLEGDTIQCPYHGLRFSAEGRCVGSPFDQRAPSALRTPAYLVAEKDGILWLWPGERARAAVTPLPDHPELRPQAGVVIRSGGYLHVESSYRLVADNLLDLSHAEFLHPFLANAGSVSRTRFSVREESGSVIATSLIEDEPATGLIRMMWEGDVPEKVDMLVDLHWSAPADMRLYIKVTSRAGDTDRAFISHQPHVVTPETETSCHYFFGNSRNMKIDDAALTEGMAQAIAMSFANEDVPMIEAQQRYSAFAADAGMTMAMLKLDEAVVRANRILDRRIADGLRAAA